MSTVASTTELQRMTPVELRQEIALHQSEYAKMRMGVEMQKEKNHALYKAKRREIARMKTVETGMKKSAPKVSAKTASQMKKKTVKVPRSK
ncbi:50S ribosomal protein L29 [Candidatus Peribacteria bacterium]|nr:50S ribosomal protein L29 [Candidatus Peribacteria bacterium]